MKITCEPNWISISEKEKENVKIFFGQILAILAIVHNTQNHYVSSYRYVMIISFVLLQY